MVQLQRYRGGSRPSYGAGSRTTQTQSGSSWASAAAKVPSNVRSTHAEGRSASSAVPRNVRSTHAEGRSAASAVPRNVRSSHAEGRSASSLVTNQAARRSTHAEGRSASSMVTGAVGTTGGRPTPTYKPVSGASGMRLSAPGTTAADRAADPMNWKGIARSLGAAGDPNFAQYKPQYTARDIVGGPAISSSNIAQLPTSPALTPGVAPRTPSETSKIRKRPQTQWGGPR